MSQRKKTRKEKILEQKAAHDHSRQNKSEKGTKRKDKPNRKEKTSKTWIVPILLLIGLTFSVYFNTTDNQFVNWDDDKNFYENDFVANANDFWSNTKEIFKFENNVIGNYNPLTTWTFLVEYKIFGLDNPGAWHLNNVILHILCVLLIYFIGIGLKLNWQASLFFAALFAVQPMRVESVAWVTERKDVLYGVFYLSALLLYIKSLNLKKNYTIAIVILAILALLSKIQAVTLPLSMLAVDYYLKEKISFKDILNKWVFWLLSLFFGVLGVYVLNTYGSLESNSTFAQWQRFFIGSYSYLVYLIKSIIPYRLSPLYPYPAAIPAWFYPTILIFPLALFAAWRAHLKGYKSIVFGLGFFTFNIFFMLQILGAGQGFLADRFTYIAYAGIFFILAYYFQKGIQHSKYRIACYSVATIAVIAYSVLSFNQNKVWKNSGTLWTHVIKYYKDTTLPFGNRANYYRDNGMTDKALADYNTRLQLDQTDPAPYNSRGRLYFNSTDPNDWNRALADYNKAIQLDPSDGEYWSNRGAIHAKMNNIDFALRDLNKSIELKPDHAVAYLNRSLMYNMTGDIPNALSDITSYLNLKPTNADLWYERARCHRQLKNENQALQDLNNAIKYGNKGVYFNERCKVNIALGNKVQARQDYTRASQLGYPVDANLQQYFN